MKQLDFTLSLIDKLTRPLKQAQASVTGFADKSKDAFKRIGVGALAMWGVAQTVRGALSPAIDMFDALNEASARGIDGTALQTVQRDALLFSATYGASAVEFVNSTAQINGAIDGLTATELPKMTKVANTLAFAMKATSEETSEFMRQMFGNFKTDADRLGKVQFAEQLAGKMTVMRQRFGAEMGLIKDLMEGARGVGNNFNIGIDEQLAVLGQLSRTLGTEASSAYEQFMNGAGEGAKKLGLSFKDAQGNMLSMPEMLIKLQGKYGKSLEGNLKAQKELDDAFGDSSAVVKQLYGNIDVLQRNITELGGADGLRRTQEMAQKMVKPWDRFVAILNAAQTVIGLTLLPVLYPLLNRLADMGQTFVRWMQMFPNIARVVGYVTLAVLSLAGAGALANIIMGVSSFVAIGLGGAFRFLIAALKISTYTTAVHTIAVFVATKAIAAWNLILKTLRGVLLAVRMAAMMAGIGINLMSWPILLIIGAIALLVAGCYLLVKHWDAIKAAVMNTEAFKVVAGAVAWVAGLFASAWQYISDGWNNFIALLTGFSPLESLAGMANGIMGLFDNVWNTIKSTFLKSWNWIVEKLNNIPGVDISIAGETTTPPVSEQINSIPGVGASLVSEKITTPIVTKNSVSTGGEVKGLEKGGISKIINSNTKSMTDQSKHYGTVNIYPSEAMTPGQLAEWSELQ